MKRLIRLLLCFSLFCAFIFCMPVSADDSLTLRVGLYENSPKIFTDENGDAAGFWPEILEYIASEEDWQIDYVPGTWTECLERLENNEIDVMPDVAYTEERAELYDFSTETVYVSWSTVYTREGADIESIPDLEGKTVAVMWGSVNYEGPEGIKTLASNFGVGCTFLEVNSYTEVFELVSSGEADVGVTSKDFGHLHAADFNLAETAIIFQPSSLYFAFPKDASLTPYLIGRIDSRVQELKADADSIYYQSLENWFGIKPVGKPVIPDWMKWALIGVGGLALLLVGGGLLLRSQVRARTKELREEVAQRQQVDEALEKSEQRFQALMEEAPIGICNTDLKGKITYVNKRFEEVSGYSRQEIVGKNAFKLGIFSAGTLKLLVKRLEERLMGRPSRLLEIQFKCKDGHWIWVAIEGKLIREKGIPVGFQIIARDITERKKAEERERHLNLVLKALRDINQLITREKDRGRLIQKGCEILVNTRGYERAWIALVDENKRPVSVVAAGLGDESPVFLKQMKSGKYPECVKELWSQDSTFLGLDCPGAQHKGCILAEIHSRRGVYRCRLEYDGKVYGMLGVTVPSEMFTDEKEKDLFLELGGDISYALKAIDEEERRYQAEDELRQSEANLAEAQRMAHIGSWELDLVSNKLTWSGEVYRMFGLQPQQFGATYEAFLDNIHLDDREMVNKAYTDSVRTKTPYDIVHRLLLKDGTVKYVNERCETFYDDGGKPLRSMGTVQDVTERQQAEEALRESEARYRAVIEGAHDMIQSVSLDGRIIFVNKSWLDTLGYTEAELSGLNLFEIIHPDSRAHCQKLFMKVVGGKAVHGIEAAFLTKDGRKILLEGNAAPRYIGDRVVATQGIFRDVTGRKQAEEALQAEKNKLQSIISAIEYGISIQDRDYNILYESRPSRLDGGYHPGEKCYRAYEGSDEVCDECPMAKAFKDGKSHTSERKVVSSSGEVLFLENTANPLRDDGGKISSCLEVIHDITERKQTEEELRLRAQLLDSATDSIFVHDLDENFVYVNEATCRLYGYSREELLKMKLHQLVPPEQANGLATLKQETLGKGEMVFETVNLRKDGSTVPLEVHSRTIESGGIKLVLAIARDITERKQMQETLVITDRLASVGELASGIAHELNNPLTGVIGFSQLVLDKTIPDDVREDVDMVYREAQRAAQVVKNLLTFARKHAPEKQMMNINKVIEKVLELRAYEQKVNNIRVDNRLDPDLPEAMADYFQLQQVFLNIIINAEFFMKEAHNGGTLTITTKRAGNNVRASFADDGPGIAEGSLGHLFDPFFTTKEVGKGTGLGLSICHGIVTEHGGRIYAESKPGGGATFTVELPIGGRRRGRGAK